MIRSTAIAFALSATTYSNPAFSLPQRLICDQRGAFTCVGGICIDGTRWKGRHHYRFDIQKGLFKGPKGKGRILSVEDSSDGVSLLHLSDSTELVYAPDRKNRWGHVVVDVRPRPAPETYVMPELWCRD